MTLRFTLGVTGAALSIAALPLFAQETVPLKPFRIDEDKPVLRAEPVQRPVPIVPVPVATPIPRAVPVAPPRATVPPKATPPPRTTAPAKTPPAPDMELADPGGEITVRPGVRTTPDEIQLSIADNFYARKTYDAAAAEYEKYLGLYPFAAGRATALFRLGESYRLNGTVNAARNSFETLLNHFSTGEFVGPAAYRLGELYYGEKNFNAALPMFRRASVRLKDAKLVNSAKFFTGRCLEGLGQKSEARGVYEELASIVPDNPFFDASRLSYAQLLKETGRTSEAVKQVQALARETENIELKAQATVYSGLWELELNRPVKAADELKKALEMPGISRWRDVAQVGLLQVLFNNEKYGEVIEIYRKTEKEFTAETRPQLLLLVARSYRLLGQHNNAIPLLDKIGTEFSNSPYAKEAVFERLKSLYASGDAKLVTEIDKYLQTTPDTVNRDQALLMKAEVLFKKPDYAAAAPLYSQVADSRTLAAVLKSEALYKAGLCLLETGQLDAAVKAFTTLRERYPTFKALPSAVCRTALARLRLNDVAGALRDFNVIIDKYPKTKERELSLYQKAHILGKQGDNQGMAETFKLLLKDYPETSEKADANYWIGWVAFENKDYEAAPDPLSKARDLDKEEYFERASLRIILSRFNSEDLEATAEEVENYTKGGGKGQVPYDVVHWLGHTHYERATTAQRAGAALEGYIAHLQSAAKWLGMVCAREDAKREDFHELGLTYNGLHEYQKATAPLQKYLEATPDPSPRAQGLLTLAKAQIGLKQFAEAQKSVDEAAQLQPDGRVNAEAREAAGDILLEQQRFIDAARMYEQVSLIIDDEQITPRAMEKAVEAYRKAGKEAEAAKLLNTLKSRYPEYFQQKNRQNGP